MFCKDRDNHGHGAKYFYLDRDWNMIANGFNDSKIHVKRPVCLDQAIKLAETLSSPFPFVRVDFYLLGERIVFGELTFTPAAGMDVDHKLKPFNSNEDLDHIYGRILQLPENNGGMKSCESRKNQIGGVLRLRNNAGCSIRNIIVNLENVFRCTMTHISPVLNVIVVYKVKGISKLNLKHPQTYNEKIQWQKVYDHNPLYTQLADKYAVREYVADKAGEQYLIPLLGKWDRFEDIDFNSLPNQFVLKCNHDCASVIICKDKKTFDVEAAKKKLKRALNRNFYYGYAEWQYKDIVPCILAEKYMQDGESDDLRDYKFQCFSGKPYSCRIDIGRFTDHRRNVYDMEWNLLPWQKGHYKNSDVPVEKPKGFDEMVEVVKKLSDGLRQVRVDLYNINGHIYFGELTFTNGGGYEVFVPEEYDRFLGDLWDIS